VHAGLAKVVWGAKKKHVVKKKARENEVEKQKGILTGGSRTGGGSG